ncbi:sensor histidine kinase [Puniceicoccaceae bacterium K14]|nr:sensor histidine kinase [Puniceicoccaceae bacterium K14]
MPTPPYAQQSGLQHIRDLSTATQEASNKWGLGFLIVVLLGVIFFPWVFRSVESVAVSHALLYYLGVLIMTVSWLAIGYLSNAKGLYADTNQSWGTWQEILLYYLALVPSAYFTLFWGTITFGTIGFNQVLVFIVASFAVFIVPIWMLAITLVLELLLFHFGLQIFLGYRLMSPGIVLGIGSGMAFGCMMFLLLKKEGLSRLTMQSLIQQLDQANQKLRSFSIEIENLSVAKERIRIAREMHDTLGHSLTVVNVQLEAANALIEKGNPSQAQAFLQKAKEINRTGLQELRTTVSSLRSSPLEGKTLDQSISELANHSRKPGLAITFQVSGDFSNVEEAITSAIYRIAQEALTNIDKHSRASEALVSLTLEEDEISLTVKDNGVGCDSVSDGFGILGIQERIQILNGETKIKTSTGKGFKLQVLIPL